MAHLRFSQETAKRKALRLMLKGSVPDYLALLLRTVLAKDNSGAQAPH